MNPAGGGPDEYRPSLFAAHQLAACQGHTLSRSFAEGRRGCWGADASNLNRPQERNTHSSTSIRFVLETYIVLGLDIRGL